MVKKLTCKDCRCSDRIELPDSRGYKICHYYRRIVRAGMPQEKCPYVRSGMFERDYACFETYINDAQDAEKAGKPAPDKLEDYPNSPLKCGTCRHKQVMRSEYVECALPRNSHPFSQMLCEKYEAAK